MNFSHISNWIIFLDRFENKRKSGIFHVSLEKRTSLISVASENIMLNSIPTDGRGNRVITNTIVRS